MRARGAAWRARPEPGYIAALTLSIMGAAFIFSGLALYPHEPPLLAPSYARLKVLTGGQLTDLDYFVGRNPKTGRDNLIVGAFRTDNDISSSESLDDEVDVEIDLPLGSAPLTCEHPTCYHLAGALGYYVLYAVLHPVASDDGTNSYGGALFHLKSSYFGYSTSRASAEVAMPAVNLNSGGTTLEVSYPIPRGGGYDWSAWPPDDLASDYTQWDEPIGNEGALVQHIGTGVSLADQNASEFDLFLASAMFALGGAALLAIVPEVLHVGHERSQRSRRRRAARRPSVPQPTPADVEMAEHPIPPIHDAEHPLG